MISELCGVYRVMEEMGAVKETHPHWKPGARDIYLILYLDAEGHIENADLLAKDRGPQLRNFAPDNQNTFPSFKLPALSPLPTEEETEQLLDSGDFSEEEKKTLSEKAREYVLAAEDAPTLLTRLLKATDDTVPDKRKILDRVDRARSIAKMFLSIVPEDEPDLNAFRALCERTLLTDPACWREELVTLLGDRDFPMPPEKGSVESAIVRFLIQDGGRVLLDVSPGEGDLPQDPFVQEEINDLLLMAQSQAGTEELIPSGRFDIFGNPMPQPRKQKGKDTFPKVAVSVLGEVILRCQNEDIPSLTRYGHEESMGCPVADESRQKARMALTWLTDPERKDSTWTPIGDLWRGADKGLLCVCPLPKICDDPALFLADDTVDDAVLFETKAEEIVTALNDPLKTPGVGDLSDRESPIFIVAKANKANTWFHSDLVWTPNMMIRGARDWARALNNMPDPVRRASPAKGSKAKKGSWKVPRPGAVPLKPVYVKPTRLVRLLNEIGAKGDKARIRRFTIRDAYDLLLGDPRTPRICRRCEEMLRWLLDKRGREILALGKPPERGAKARNVKEKELAQVLTAMGVLLWKLGERKDDFMKNSLAYRLGQVLAAFDNVQRAYAGVDRGGKEPWHLIGHDMVSARHVIPERVVNSIRKRMRPYETWYRQTGKDVPNAGRAMGYFRSVMGALGRAMDEADDALMGTDMSPRNKAILYAGYTARFEKFAASGEDVGAGLAVAEEG